MGRATAIVVVVWGGSISCSPPPRFAATPSTASRFRPPPVSESDDTGSGALGPPGLAHPLLYLLLASPSCSSSLGSVADAARQSTRTSPETSQRQPTTCSPRVRPCSTGRCSYVDSPRLRPIDSSLTTLPRASSPTGCHRVAPPERNESATRRTRVPRQCPAGPATIDRSTVCAPRSPAAVDGPTPRPRRGQHPTSRISDASPPASAFSVLSRLSFVLLTICSGRRSWPSGRGLCSSSCRSSPACGPSVAVGSLVVGAGASGSCAREHRVCSWGRPMIMLGRLGGCGLSSCHEVFFPALAGVRGAPLVRTTPTASCRIAGRPGLTSRRSS